jgi:hypothetical protein
VDPSAHHSQVTPAVRRVIYFPGRLPDEKKGNMFGRSTPSPGRAPDGPLNLNGSINSADTATATLLHHPPAETGTADRDGAPAREESAEQSTVTAGIDQAAPTGLGEPDKHHMGRAGVRGPLAGAGRELVGWRGLRSSVSGVALVVLAASLGLSSAPATASLIAGVLMLIVGLIGSRLQGRFAIEFGPHGASIEIQTHMAPRGRTRVAGALAPWKPTDSFIAPGGEDARPKPAHDPTTSPG